MWFAFQSLGCCNAEAATTVMDLYNLNGSPSCIAVRMLAKQLGVELNLKHLVLFEGEHLRPEYLEINPFHKVPTLVDNGFVLYESNAILYYLINKYAPNSSLYPKGPQDRARVDKVLATITSTIQPHYFAFFRPQFYDKKRPTAENIRTFEENVLRGFQHLIGDGKYASGDTLTIADFSLVAHLTLALELPHYKPGTFPKLEAYYDRLKRDISGFEEMSRPILDAVKQFCETQLE